MTTGGTKWVYRFGGGTAEGRGRDAQPARRQGRQPRRDEQSRPAGAARLHHHHRGLHPLLRQRPAPIRPSSKTEVGARAGARSRRRSAPSSAIPSNPLLVSVRSGARVSMPGMMDTVLNLGLNDDDRRGPGAAQPAIERFAYDSYRRFIQMYGDVVLGVEHHHFEELLENHKEDRGRRPRHRARRRRLEDSWSPASRPRSGGDRASPSRRIRRSSCGAPSARCSARWMNAARRHLPQAAQHPGGLGHRGQRPGDGVRQHGRRLRHRRRLHPQSRRPASNEFYGEYPGQRPGRGRGRRHPHAAAPDHRRQEGQQLERCRRWKRRCRRLFAELRDVRRNARRRTTATCRTSSSRSSSGKLWMLQTRTGKRTAQAALQDRRRDGRAKG